MRKLIDGKAMLLLALLVNGAIAAFFFTLPGPVPALVAPQPAPRAASPLLPLPEATGDAALPDLVCRRWGPVGDASAFASLAARIEAAGGAFEVKETPVAGEPDHLVLMGPAASPAATRRLRDELRSQSIPNQLINEGRFAGALSVGVFADLAAAQALQSELAALGYRVTVETLDSPRKAYHLETQSPRKAPAFALPSTPCRTASS
ncbi:MAG: hypothetical protein F4171_10610 [Gammaproteobacteria bacterium]|nr:hypothetical protein [Gammaproteobacteria bacterium]MYG13230.1 hypothetical protein [Gammaproteobacteria bacterium]